MPLPIAIGKEDDTQAIRTVVKGELSLPIRPG